jgi:hypothetical protein
MVHLGNTKNVTGVDHIYRYPRTKPPILEVGFSRQGELCEHFLFGNRKTEHRRKRTEMTDDTDVGLLLCNSPIPWQPDSPVLASPVSRQQETTIICSLALSLSPAVISRCHSWVMLLLVYVGPRATHFTGYCCWFTKVCGASGSTLYWVLLAYVGSRATHFTGYCC